MNEQMLWLGAITLLAATVNGALGYGFSSITVPLALLFLSNRVLNPALIIIEVPLNAYVLWVNRASLGAVWRRVAPMIVGLVPGVLAGQSQPPFARAIDRDLLGDDLGARQGEARGEPCPEILGDIAHGAEIGRSADVEPMPELADAHAHLARGHADRGERLAEARAREADQGRLVGGARRDGGVVENGHVASI